MRGRNKRNILFLVQNLSVPFDRRVWMEATSLHHAGYSVTIICRTMKNQDKLIERLDGIRILRFPLPFEGRGKIGIILEYLWSVFCIFTVTQLVAISKKIDVAHICNPPDLLFFCVLPTKYLRKTKVLFDQHDACPEIWESKYPQGSAILRQALFYFERQTFKIADRVISPNDSYKEIAIRRGNFHPDKVRVVRSSPSIEFLNKNPKEVTSCRDYLSIAYLGTMGSQEGIDLLLLALKEIKSKRPDLKLTLDLVGDGPEKSELVLFAQDLGLSQNCIFHGRVSDSDLREIVSSADIAVNPDRPSKFNDISSMNKVIEYMALGVPIVQFATIEGERTAEKSAVQAEHPSFQSLAIAILQLSEDVDSRLAMQEFGLERFKFLCWESQVDNLLTVYEELNS